MRRTPSKKPFYHYTWAGNPRDMKYFAADVEAILTAVRTRVLTPNSMRKLLPHCGAAQRIASQIKFIIGQKDLDKAGLQRLENHYTTMTCDPRLCEILMSNSKEELDTYYNKIVVTPTYASMKGYMLSSELWADKQPHVYTLGYIMRLIELSNSKAELIPFLTHTQQVVRDLAEREMKRF